MTDKQFKEFIKCVNSVTDDLYTNMECSEKLSQETANYIKGKYCEMNQNVTVLLGLQILMLMILAFNLFC